MILPIPMLVSSLILAASCYLDMPGGFWFTGQENLAVVGNLPGSVCVGLLTTFVVMPFYGMASVIRGALCWPECTRLAVVAVLWTYTVGLVVMMRDAERIILPYLAKVFGGAFQMWFLSLAYGAPSVIWNYWVGARERRDYSP